MENNNIRTMEYTRIRDFGNPVYKCEEYIMKYKDFEGVSVLSKMPDGWRVMEGAMTQPPGCVWINNNKSFLARDEDGNRLYKSALLVVNDKWYQSYLNRGKVVSKEVVRRGI